MAKYASDAVFDAALDKIATGTIMTVCSSQPTNRTEAVTTYALVGVAIDSGDFSKSDGSVSGRKLTIASQSDVEIDANGTATHVAICDGSSLLFVTTCTPQYIGAGNMATLPSWNIEFRDPA